MRAIPNLIEEAEVLGLDQGHRFAPFWGAEVLGRAIGHDLRWWLENTAPGEPADGINYRDFIDPSLPLNLVRHHIADML